MTQLFLHIFLLFTLFQDAAIEQKVITAFKTNNIENISTHFFTQMEVNTLGKTQVCSNSQAEQILKKFISQHSLKSFNIIHKGITGDQKYFIAEGISTTGNKYTINIYFKKNSSDWLIYKLTITE